MIVLLLVCIANAGRERRPFYQPRAFASFQQPRFAPFSSFQQPTFPLASSFQQPTFPLASSFQQSTFPLASSFQSMSAGTNVFPLVSGSSLEVQQARQLLLSTPCYPQIQEVHHMSKPQLQALHVMDNNYVTQSLIDAHRNWHTDPLNSIGGIHGPGTGTPFGGMHMIMLRNYERWVGPNWKRPGWNPKLPVPSQLFIDPKFVLLGPRLTDDPQYDEPQMMHGVDPWTKVSSDDFETPDDWWRLQGLTNHASPHFIIGGPMKDSAISPGDWSCFIGWHAWLQREFERWLTIATTGYMWSQMNPFHPILTSNDISVFANSTGFMNDGVCRSYSTSPACQFLQKRQELVDSAGVVGVLG
jgi:hypothetical protein